MSIARDAVETVRFYATSLLAQLQRKDVFIWSQAIAFKALVSVVPLLIIGTGLLGPTLARVVRELLPPGQGSELLKFVDKIQSASEALTIIGVLGLVFAGVTLFSTLRAVLANVFAAEWHTHRSIPRGYLFDLRMATQIGVLFVLTIAISAALQTYNVSGSALLARYDLEYLWWDSGWRAFVQILGLLVPVAITTLIFFQLYYLTPLPHPPKRSVTAGAFFAAVLFELSKVAFAFYAGRLGAFDRYGSGDVPDGLGVGEAFGMIIAFVFWAYYSGLVLIMGAIVVLLHESRVRESRSESDG